MSKHFSTINSRGVISWRSLKKNGKMTYSDFLLTNICTQSSDILQVGDNLKSISVNFILKVVIPDAGFAHIQ